MICPICGTHLNDDLKFCTQCGTPLSNAAPSYAPVDDNPTELFNEAPTGYQADVYQPNVPQADVYQPGVVQTPSYEATPSYDVAPAYDAPAQYGQDYATYEAPSLDAEEKKDGKLGLIFGIISLVLAILVPLICCCTIVGTIISLFIAIASIVLGAIGIKFSKKSDDKVGLILSIIGLILGCLTALLPLGYLIYLIVVFCIYGAAVGGTVGLGFLEEIFNMF